MVMLVFDHLDPATRRDLGFRPRRVALPRLDLHFDRIERFGFNISSLTINGDIKTLFWRDARQIMIERWTEHPFMVVNGVTIRRTEIVSRVFFDLENMTV